MLKLVVQGRNIDITDAIRQYVHEKIERAVSHFSHLASEVDINLSVERNPRISNSHSAEVTLYANGKVIRAQESSENMYASIDRVSDKIARQLRKFKERNGRDKTKHRPKTSVAVSQQPLNTAPNLDREPELPPEIVRSKYFAMPPMSVSDALHQLDLVDHDFFVFRNADTDEINVIYERNHGGYGVICPRK
ncbi:ribosome hibernation-promoting factor, HPF/YfiA family [Synechococcus sp. PCC 7336]|uniref:ribosome hibernation-promoting factor, HPF/YfiA family n=1 Tax=Synechococcus sp. PCC 7336 TaxID=195250 RepID=UPI00034CCED4|nr:ribosome-associated translation inhibitor RaiA [Synechococcus sp. PCC 7336]